MYICVCTCVFSFEGFFYLIQKENLVYNRTHLHRLKPHALLETSPNISLGTCWGLCIFVYNWRLSTPWLLIRAKNLQFYVTNFFFLSHTCSTWTFLGQKSNRSCSCWPRRQPRQYWIQAASATYPVACGNTRSLTHWARPGIEPTSSWILDS